MPDPARPSADVLLERPRPLTYDAVRDALRGRNLPCALLDLDLLDWNAHELLRRAGTRPIRLGTKSIRSVDVLRRVLALSPRFAGLLCYSAREAVWLASLGFDDLLVAYPTVEPAELEAVAAAVSGGARIALMVDDPRQLAAPEAAAARHGAVLGVCIDLDMSTKFPGLHFGVRRSPVRAPEHAVTLARAIAAHPQLRLEGLMGYEAQIAGLADAQPRAPVKSAIVRALKRRSLREIVARRQATVAALRAAGVALRFVNGGGTGSVEATAADDSVTEVSAGSALYGPALFDGFRTFTPAPALTFALPIVRCPEPGTYTCMGGGYVASGPAGGDRLPLPYLPAGAKLLPAEGAGEVQTPVRYAGATSLEIGDPVVFRHAKAGELCERFERLLCIERAAVGGEYETYRGAGQCFF